MLKRRVYLGATQSLDTSAVDASYSVRRLMVTHSAAITGLDTTRQISGLRWVSDFPGITAALGRSSWARVFLKTIARWCRETNRMSPYTTAMGITLVESHQKSAYGVLFIRGERHTLDYAELNNCHKEQLSLNINTVGSTVGDFVVNNSLHIGMYIEPGAGCSINRIIFNNANIPLGNTACQIRNANASIGEIRINGSGSSSGSGVFVEQRAKSAVRFITCNNINGMSMWVRPGGRAPSAAHLTNLPTATRPIMQISANQSACTGYYIDNRSASGGQATIYAEPDSGGAISTWVGCEGAIPLAQGGATLNAATTSNRFY